MEFIDAVLIGLMIVITLLIVIVLMISAKLKKYDQFISDMDMSKCNCSNNEYAAIKMDKVQPIGHYRQANGQWENIL